MMNKIKEMNSKFYGIKDLCGGNGTEVCKKAWKATGVSLVIYGAVVGTCALLDKVFTKHYEQEQIDHNNMVNGLDESIMSTEEKLDDIHKFHDKVQKECYIVTGILGSIIGLIGTIGIWKALKK